MTPMNDEFEDVSKNNEESQKRLDKIVLANTEKADIESRRNNIILYRVPQSSQALADERRKEDVSLCEQFLAALRQAGSGVDTEDIKRYLGWEKEIWKQDRLDLFWSNSALCMQRTY